MAKIEVHSILRVASAFPCEWEGLTRDFNSVYVYAAHGEVRIGTSKGNGTLKEAIANAFSDVYVKKYGNYSDDQLSYTDLVKLTEEDFSWPPNCINDGEQQ